MKLFAILFLVAFAAYASANEMAFHRALFDFLDERHEHKMAQVVRDYGLPEDTLVANDHAEPPAYIKTCIDKSAKCWKAADRDACKKLDCIDNFFKCCIENHPTPLPSIPPLQKGCIALLHLCRERSPSCAGEMCCFVRIKRCFELGKKE